MEAKIIKVFEFTFSFHFLYCVPAPAADLGKDRTLFRELFLTHLSKKYIRHFQIDEIYSKKTVF